MADGLLFVLRLIEPMNFFMFVLVIVKESAQAAVGCYLIMQVDLGCLEGNKGLS